MKNESSLVDTLDAVVSIEAKASKCVVITKSNYAN